MATLYMSLSATQGLLGGAPSRAGCACWGRLVAKPGTGLEPAGIPRAQWGWAHRAEVAGPDFEGHVGHVNEFGGYPGIVGSEQWRLGHLCGFQGSFWKLWGGMWIRAGMGMCESD